ncbi:MAG: hypothetical protein JZU50_11210 [Desulfobulbaceae bacterium]|jgi:hypothetical protein|nr:hypothetical protein [Desulfobulbaceae bacterium]
MVPKQPGSTAQRWWSTSPLNRLFFAITGTVLVFLFIVCSLSIRQYLLYDQCQQAVAAGDRLLFQFTTIKGHLDESLILLEDVNLRALDSELQTLGKEAEGLASNILVPERLKMSLISRSDLIDLEVRLRAIQEQRQEKAKETAELIRSLNAININLQQFRFHLSDYTQTILLGLHKIIAGALGLIVAMTCSLLFMLNRHLAVPVLNLCRITENHGAAETVNKQECSLEELTARISRLLAMPAASESVRELPNICSADTLQREALRYRYGAAGYISAEITSEIINIINGVINYTQTLIDINEQEGDSRQQCTALYQSLFKEEKKIADLVAGMHMVRQGPPSPSSSVSLPSLFTMLALVLDKPLRSESILFNLPAECRFEVQIPAGDLWLVLLTLTQSGRRALNQAFPGKKPNKHLTIECGFSPSPENRILTLSLSNSAASWPEDTSVAGTVWPSLTFCTHLLQFHHASLTLIEEAKGNQILLEIPCRKAAA